MVIRSVDPHPDARRCNLHHRDQSPHPNARSRRPLVGITCVLYSCGPVCTVFMRHGFGAVFRVFLFPHQLNGIELFWFNSSTSRSILCHHPSSILKMVTISSKSPSLYSKYLSFIPLVYMVYVVVFSYPCFRSTLLPLPNLVCHYRTPALSLTGFHCLPQPCSRLLREFTQHLPHQPGCIRIFGCREVLP